MFIFIFSPQVAGKLRLVSLPDNLTSWSAGDLARLGNLSIVLSPAKLMRLDPKVENVSR